MASLLNYSEQEKEQLRKIGWTEKEVEEKPVKAVLLAPSEIRFLTKWLGKIVDRGDLLEEIVEDDEEQVAQELYREFTKISGRTLH